LRLLIAQSPLWLFLPLSLARQERKRVADDVKDPETLTIWARDFFLDMIRRIVFVWMGKQWKPELPGFHCAQS
jgi:hypothetical protein